MTRWPYRPLHQHAFPHCGAGGDQCFHAGTIAEHVHVTRRTIERWKHAGLTTPQADRAATALGVHPSQIWDHWDQGTEAQPPPRTERGVTDTSHLDWHDHAACRDKDPDLWFPPDGPYTVANTQPARFICLDCPAYDACWDWAIPRLDLDGIWAGTTPQERKHIRATNNITAVDDNLDRILDLHPNTPEPEEDHAA